MPLAAFLIIAVLLTAYRYAALQIFVFHPASIFYNITNHLLISIKFIPLLCKFFNDSAMRLKRKRSVQADLQRGSPSDIGRLARIEDAPCWRRSAAQIRDGMAELLRFLAAVDLFVTVQPC